MNTLTWSDHLSTKWPAKRLRYVTTLRTQRTEASSDDRGYVGLENIESWTGRFIQTDNGNRTGDTESEAQGTATVFKVGEILFGKLRPYLAKVMVAENNGICSTELLVLKPSKELNARFLAYVLLCPQFITLVDSSTFGAKMPRANWDFIGAIQVPLPSLPAQCCITRYLDTETAQIDALVVDKGLMLTLLEEKRAALVSRVVTQGLYPDVPLKPSGLDWLGAIPVHWEVLRGKFLFRQSALPVDEDDEIVTCFRDGQVTLRKNRRVEGFTNAEKELGYQGIRVGQLVLHSMDAFAGAIGVSDSNGKCSPEYIICDPIQESILNEYYGQLLRVMALRGFIQATCTAVRERAPRIRFSHLADMFLPVPPLDEQKAIIAELTRERARTAELEVSLYRSIALLKERRSALITAAVTGSLAPEAMSA